MAAILVLVGLVVVFFGFFSLSEATMGVGILAVGCFLGILARIAQADAHQKQLKQLLSTSAVQPEAPKKAAESTN